MMNERMLFTVDYSRGSVKDVAAYYLSYKDEFEEIREKISESDIEYPVMKVMDMCLWQAAFEKDTRYHENW